jgi:hypothetical protein
MKTNIKSILLIAIATLTFAAAPAAQATDRCYSSGYRTITVTVTHCAPKFVCTREVCRRTECRYAYDHCGRRISFEVVVITYADFYSDGSRRTYTRTHRA